MLQKMTNRTKNPSDIVNGLYMGETIVPDGGESMQTYLGVEIKLSDGSVIVPNVYIDGQQPNATQQSIDMSNYYQDLYKGKGLVESIRVNSSPIMLGIKDIESAKTWEEFRIETFSNIEDPKVAIIISGLNKEGISAEIISDLINDLNPEKNEKLLRDYIELLIEDELDKKQTFKALDLCIEAHKGQSQEKDNNGLNNIPYSNHSIVIALWALTVLKESPEVVQAYLLHDVVEDTNYNIVYIQKEFGMFVESIIDDVTKREDETRKEYLERVKNLQRIESKRLKSLDRYQNLLRALTRTKIEYIERYIRECDEIYSDFFREDELLGINFNIKFQKTLEELRKHLEYLKQE